MGTLAAAALLGLWVGVMWGALDRVQHQVQPNSEISAPPAVLTEP